MHVGEASNDRLCPGRPDAPGAARACDQGPVEKAGKDVDRATGQDGLVSKGPAQKAGRNVDNALGDKR
jgi:hypothetical protein